MDWPLPLWKVLGEEVDELRRRDGADALGAIEPDYYYKPDDVVDPDLLQKQVAARESELRPIVERNLATITAGLTYQWLGLGRAWSPIDPAFDLQSRVLKINILLESPDLHTALPNLPQSMWIKNWIHKQPAPLTKEQIIPLNRTLLDHAFGGAVKPIDDIVLSQVIGEIHKEGLSALCFSGGGIRSATFCLGVVQALARKGLLDKFDYLSTVSGGGFLGGWLAAWTNWNKGDLPDIVNQLSSAKASKLEPEPDPVFYLRNFSNYLTPRTGLLSTDTWTLLGIFLRNLILHWSVILPPVVALMLVPYLMLALMRHRWILIGHLSPQLAIYERAVCFSLAIVTMAFAVFYEGLARPSHLDILKERSRWWLAHRGQGSFLAYFLAPLMLSGFFFTTYVYRTPGSGIVPFIVYGSFAGVLGWSLNALLLGGKLFKRYIAIASNFIAVGLSGVLGGVILFKVTSAPIVSIFRTYPPLYFCLMPPIILTVFLLAATIFIGLVSLFTTDEDREYWARMGAWALIGTLGWTAYGGVALFGPLLFLSHLAIPAASTTMVSSVVTAYLGWSSKTGARTESRAGVQASSLLQRGLPILGAIAITLILCALSLAGIALVRWLSGLYISASPSFLSLIHNWLPGCAFTLWTAIPMQNLGLSLWSGSFSGLMAAVMLGLVTIFSFVTSLFIDVNKYSLHAMYRNRIIRAYLGASRDKGERHPNPFTGFDPDDNLEMWMLWTKEPRKLMPVINISLNLVAPISDKLAWQERKAESFTVTPFHVGSLRSGYRRSQSYASKNVLWFQQPLSSARDRPLTLGTATAISGAAVSPNMGYNSSPIVTMLLSIFNVRLGWWLGNPGAAGNETYMRAQPGFGVKYFADEALGRTGADQPFVYLSDGGHFENLGLYEMVLRRCHTILVIDADQDSRTTFENLGNAIRKIRIDLGISIEFPTFPNFAKRNRGGGKTAYCAVGLIRYAPEDPGAPDGFLIYVKPTIVGTEPTDVLNYEKRCGEFPHETTADQWFSESQFESYRALGLHEIETIVGSLTQPKPLTDPYFWPSTILNSLR